MSKTRKVMHVEVFDFDSDTMAYAKGSGKINLVISTIQIIYKEEKS